VDPHFQSHVLFKEQATQDGQSLLQFFRNAVAFDVEESKLTTSPANLICNFSR
jgi:hypothetical protein